MVETSSAEPAVNAAQSRPPSPEERAPQPAAKICRSLSLMQAPRRRPRAVLQRLVDYVPADAEWVGPNSPVAHLCERTAALLGKEAALFLPTGKMAQQISLRIHAERSNRTSVACHPACHLLHYEMQGFAVVHGLRMHAIGDANRLLATSDIEGVAEPLAAVVFELPQRDIGGQLPGWDDLVEQATRTAELGAARHLDGARIWEAQPGYDRGLDEIAGLFDTVYVSLYKLLEAPRGALLVGDRDFIRQAFVWALRLGGDSAGNWPNAAIALMGLDEILPRVKDYHAHAIAIAAALGARDIDVVPSPPQTPLFHVHLPVSMEAAMAAHQELLSTTDTVLFQRLMSSPKPTESRLEISVMEHVMDFEADELAELLAEIVARARIIDAARKEEL